MIKSFRCKDTEKLFRDKRVSRFHSIEWQARKKLLYLHAAESLQIVGAFPGNRLEVLRGNRKGQVSFALTSSGGFALSGKMGMLTTLKLLIITKEIL